MWLLEKHLRCDSCGTRLEEWDPKKGGDLHAFIPQVFTCPGCEVSGKALETHQKYAKASGGGHGARVRMVPRYVNDYLIKTRTPAQRQRMMEIERERIEFEKSGGGESHVEPRNAKGIGSSKRPPPIGQKPGLSEGPPENAPTE